MKTYLTVRLVCLALTSALSISCSSSYLSPPSAPSIRSAYVSNAATEAWQKPKDPKAQARVLIKTGTINLRVKDVKMASTSAKDLIKQHRGYLESTSSDDDKDAYTHLKIRVPNNNLVPLMDGLADLGKVSSRRVKVEDVTEQWIDLQAKINNLRALRNRLRKLLNQAKNVKETLEVEKELTRVQSELDSLEGKIKAMQKHVAYSKLTVSIRQKSISGPIGAVGKGAWWGIKKLFVIR